MSNGGSVMDSIRGLFSSGGGGQTSRSPDRDPVEARMGRIEQIASGVRMAAAALEDDLKGLRREAEEVAGSALEAARERVGSERSEGSAATGADRSGTADALSRVADALEELHYRVVRIEVHRDVESDEDRERAAEEARDSLERVRDAVEGLTEAAGA